MTVLVLSYSVPLEAREPSHVSVWTFLLTLTAICLFWLPASLSLFASRQSKWTAQWRLCRQRRSDWCDLWVRRRRSCRRCGSLHSCSSRHFSRSARRTAGSWEICRANCGRRSVRSQNPYCEHQTGLQLFTDVSLKQRETLFCLFYKGLQPYYSSIVTDCRCVAYKLSTK